MTNDRNPKERPTPFSSFGLRHSFGFQVSSFELHTSPAYDFTVSANGRGVHPKSATNFDRSQVFSSWLMITWSRLNGRIGAGTTRAIAFAYHAGIATAQRFLPTIASETM